MTGSGGPAAPDEKPDDSNPTLGVRIVGYLVARRVAVSVFWLCLLLCGLPLAYFTNSDTVTRIDPAKHTATGQAHAKMLKEFPRRVFEVNEVVMINCDSCTSILDEDFTRYALAGLDAEMKLLQLADPGVLESWDSPHAASDAASNLKKMAHFLDVPSLPNPYLSPDGKTVTYHTVWQFSKEVDLRSLTQVRRLMRYLKQLNEQGREVGFRVVVVGPLSVTETMNAESAKEMLLKEACMIPIAIGILIWQVRSPRLAILAGLTMAVSIFVSLGLIFFLEFKFSLSPTCPLIAMVLCVALSVDYSLFIFSRFREELQSGVANTKALEISIVSAGHVILISGCVLESSFLVGLLLPGEAVWCMSLAGIIAVGVIMAVHLTLSPCMMSLFNDFFSYGLTVETVYCGGGTSRGSSAWMKWGQCLTKGWWPYVTIVILYGAMVPVILQMAKYHPSTDLLLEIPKGSMTDQAYRLAKTSIPIGDITPVLLLHTMGDVQNNEAFEAGCRGIQQLVESTRGTEHELTPEDFTSPFAVPGAMAGLTVHVPGNCPPLTCFLWDQSPPDCPFLPSAKQMLSGGSLANMFLPGLDKTYQDVWQFNVNRRNSSALTKVSPRFVQTGRRMKGLYRALRAVEVDGIFGLQVSLHEISDSCYRRLPLVVLLILIVMSVFIGFAFGAVLVPLKLFLSVVIPLAFVYGVLVCVYQEGALAWTHFAGVQPVGIYWLIPILTLPLLIGLAVDYDVFLFARVVELRKEGYSNNLAVVGAMAATGPSITSAGLIMAFAFGGMLLSVMKINAELGFCVAFGVLLDTFVIRGALVPCVLSVGDSMNYWPQKMPEPTLTMEDLKEHLSSVALPNEMSRSISKQGV